MKTMSFTARLSHRPHILKQEAAGTVVLLNLHDGQYFALDGVGARVWNLCDGCRTVSEILAILGQEYEAPAPTIEQDVAGLMNELAKAELISENA